MYGDLENEKNETAKPIESIRDNFKAEIIRARGINTTGHIY